MTMAVFYARPLSRIPAIVSITGASSGIGRATAERLAREGHTVVISARRQERLDDLVDRITRAGGRALAVPGDVTDPAVTRALVARTVEAYGRIDVMIANAGLGYHGPIEDMRVEDMRRVVDVNVMGTLYTVQAAVDQFRRQGHGHLIVVSSFAGKRGVGGSNVYGATKAAAINLVESLRAEFVGTPLLASVVLPVTVNTEFRPAIRREFALIAEGEGPAQDVTEVARAIVDCIREPKAEVYPYPKSRYIAILNVIAPARTDRFMHKFTRRVRRAGPDDGPAGS
jgi:NADP-dependent 3-hydroxy acid dehydrogenase YdfG